MCFFFVSLCPPLHVQMSSILFYRLALPLHTFCFVQFRFDLFRQSFCSSPFSLRKLPLCIVVGRIISMVEIYIRTQLIASKLALCDAWYFNVWNGQNMPLSLSLSLCTTATMKTTFSSRWGSVTVCVRQQTRRINGDDKRQMVRRVHCIHTFDDKMKCD